MQCMSHGVWAQHPDGDSCRGVKEFAVLDMCVLGLCVGALRRSAVMCVLREEMNTHC